MSTANEYPVVASIGPEGLRTTIELSDHTFLADEPKSVGGTDEGPDPYGLLLASLGACTAMTLRLYADRKGWPLTDVRVRLAHRRLHARDCEACESNTGFVSRIDRVVELDGDLEEDQRARLEEIAARCPVHRTLTSEIVIHDHARDDRSQSM